MIDSKKNKNPRRCAREYAVQTLYQWQLSEPSVAELIVDFSKDQSFSGVDRDYWHELVTNSIEQASVLDEKMQPFLSRSLASVNPVELAILRVAFYELCFRPDIPYRVVINEAIELAKVFGAVDSHRFMNGVLDKASKKLRSIEVAKKSASDN